MDWVCAVEGCGEEEVSVSFAPEFDSFGTGRDGVYTFFRSA